MLKTIENCELDTIFPPSKIYKSLWYVVSRCCTSPPLQTHSTQNIQKELTEEWKRHRDRIKPKGKSNAFNSHISMFSIFSFKWNKIAKSVVFTSFVHRLGKMLKYSLRILQFIWLPWLNWNTQSWLTFIFAFNKMVEKRLQYAKRCCIESTDIETIEWQYGIFTS